MKFTVSWLKTHLDTDASLDAISEKLTAIGLEVESITDLSDQLAPFSVAKILEAEKHPNADKLRVCKVESDDGMLQIVCGAPNARAGLTVALAKEGAVIPANGMVIKKSTIRDVESIGMLCSSDELGIDGDSEGIIELPDSAKVGEAVSAVLGMDDPVIEIAITPNRADCLGVRGIARDLAAAGLGTLKPLEIPVLNTSGASKVSVTITDPRCQQFVGCSISGVKNAHSPDWIRNRLSAIGQRSISALVDITNYITVDLGRPLHVYDISKLSGNLTVKQSAKDAPFKALDGEAYTLPSGLCVISDDAGVQALGGVIGGEESGCTEATTDVFLEVALFEPTAAAYAGRAMQIESDARYRFERGIDVAFVEDGAKIAADMIIQLCGGSASELTYAGSAPDYAREITLRLRRIAFLSGIDVSAEEAARILGDLGFVCHATHDGWSVTPPSWRADVEGEADLIEEIIRIIGYDAIPAISLPSAPSQAGNVLTLQQTRAYASRRLLASRGMQEICSWSFMQSDVAARYGGGNAALKLKNPISSELDMMRPNLLPNLLEALHKNANRGFSDSALFEVGLQYHDITPDGQRMVAGGVRSGKVHTQHYDESGFSRKVRDVDAFDAKADALAALEALGVKSCQVTPEAPSWYHPGRSGTLSLGGKIILGHFGELHPSALKQADVDGAVCGFELFLDALPPTRAKSKAKPSPQTSDYQSVTRDFAFIVDDSVSAHDIISALSKADKKLVQSISIFDVYQGDKVEAGKKSVAVSVTLQANDRTLSDDEITAVSAAIVAEASKAFGGQLRQ